MFTYTFDVLFSLLSKRSEYEKLNIKVVPNENLKFGAERIKAAHCSPNH